MNTASKKLDKINRIVNVVVVAGIIVFALVLGYKFYSTFLNNSNQTLKVGSTIEFDGIRWEDNIKTMILILSKDCNYCTESAGFYNKLYPLTKNRHISIIAMLPSEIEESRKYLDSLGLTDIEVYKLKLNTFTIRGTPTILLVDNKGTLLKSWEGQLTPEEEKDVYKNF